VVCEGQAVYEPFVGVDLEPMILKAADPGGALGLSILNGEVTDVNDQGYAVGWYRDSSSNHDIPFLFSPVDGGQIIILPDPINQFPGANFTDSRALGLTNIPSGGDISGIVIVGYAQGTGAILAFDLEGMVWWFDTNPGVNDWVLSRAFTNRNILTGINDNLMASGWIDRSQTGNRRRALLADLDASGDGVPDLPSTNFQEYGLTDDPPPTNYHGYGYGINANNDIVGTDFLQPPETPTNQSAMFYDPLFPIGNDPTYLPRGSGIAEAFAINDSRDIVGYAGGSLSNHVPVLWWYDNALSIWTKYNLLPLPQFFFAAEATDINNQNEVVGNYSDGSGGSFYVVLDPNNPDSGHSQVENLGGMVIFPLASRSTGKAWTCNTINENGWIGGSYSPDGGGATLHPMIYIPNDVNNNEIPDIREIMVARINGPNELDVNGNWLLDSAEQMRVGLFGAAGFPANLISSVQVVRLMGLEQQALNETVTNTNGTCTANANAFNFWGYTNNTEVIVNVRTVDPQSGPDHNFDYLLSSSSNQTTIDTQKNLDDIRVFAYRFARCIDGMQFGNEIYTGPGRYMFYHDDLPISGFEGDIRDANSPGALNEASAAIFKQLGDQVEAARIGSALAGRPLRMFSPAVAAGMTKPGYCGNAISGMSGSPFNSQNDKAASGVKACVDYANANRLIFDQHTNYTSLADFQETIDKITDNFSGGVGNCQDKTDAPWGRPDFLASMENGPIPTDDWWTANSFEAKLFFADGHTCDPDQMWDKYFVDGWFQDPNEFGGYFPLPEVFGAAAFANLQYVCVNTTQQGIKSDGSLSRTVMGTLIASEMDASCVDDSNLFMPIRINYQDAADGFKVIPFNPHPEPCDSAIVCPNPQ